RPYTVAVATTPMASLEETRMLPLLKKACLLQPLALIVTALILTAVLQSVFTGCWLELIINLALS
ncbi:MAG TPA: hypothetical protein VJ508_01800, partial [Saprospiraceae bacterium]|nr:hypothetical protein [Saprospiraceae bacterium]